MIQINKKHAVESTTNEINRLLKKMLDILKSSKKEKILDKWSYTLDGQLADEFDEYLNILLNILFQKTTLKKVLDAKSCSVSIFNFYNILREIKDYENNKNLNQYFFDKLNEQLNKVTTTNFKFIFLLNTNFNDFKVNFKDLLKSFGISRFDPNKYDISEEVDVELDDWDQPALFSDILDVVNDYNGEVVDVEIEAGDVYYATDKVKFRIESFLGFLSYSTHLYSISHSYGSYPEIAKSNEDSDFRFSKFKADFYTVLTNNGVYWPEKFEFEFRGKIQANIQKIKAIKFLRGTYDLIKDHNRFKDVCNLFYLYYSATSENRLDYSFLKFWIVIERVVKISGGKSNDRMLKLINKLHTDDSLKNRSKMLIDKRNDLVHEGKWDNITQSDRNLSKMLTDITLRAYISSMSVAETNQHFDFLISNIGKQDKELIKQIELLKGLLSKEEKMKGEYVDILKGFNHE